MIRPTLTVLTMFALAMLVLTTTPASAECKGTIQITIEHVSSNSNSVTIIDQNSGKTVFSGNLAAWGKKTISVCKSDAGYGSIKYKKGGQNGWTGASLLKSGETVKI